MAEVPTAALKAISRKLDALGVSYVFTGGSIIALLLDEPEASVMRPTDDVDVIVEILTHKDYSKFEEQLRELGFDHDIREGAPKCRWIYRTLTVDTMPVKGAFLGLNTIWFDHALSNPTNLIVDGQTPASSAQKPEPRDFTRDRGTADSADFRRLKKGGGTFLSTTPGGGSPATLKQGVGKPPLRYE